MYVGWNRKVWSFQWFTGHPYRNLLGEAEAAYIGLARDQTYRDLCSHKGLEHRSREADFEVQRATVHNKRTWITQEAQQHMGMEPGRLSSEHSLLVASFWAKAECSPLTALSFPSSSPPPVSHYAQGGMGSSPRSSGQDDHWNHPIASLATTVSWPSLLPRPARKRVVVLEQILLL